MKKKNGFIATSVMFSFFLVFTMLSLLVLASYAHYRLLMNELNGEILNDLNENVISKKYVKLHNYINDGTFKSIKEDHDNNDTTYKKFFESWRNDESKNYEPYYDEIVNNYYVKLLSKSNGSTLIKTFNKKIMGNNRKIYVAFNMFRPETINCLTGTVKLKIGTIEKNMTDNNKILCGDYINWSNVNSEIINIENNDEDDDQQIVFETLGVSEGDSFIGIKNIRVVDITDLYKSGTTDEKMKEYLDSELPNDFEEDYTLEKH